MRPLSMLLSASLLLSAADVGAQARSYPPPDTAPVSWAQAIAPGTAPRIKPDEARKIRGAYEMSNGWYLRVHAGRRYIDTIIDDQQSLRLVPVGPYQFASGDRNVTMQFYRGAAGDEMVMRYRPDPRLAGHVVIWSRIVRR